MVSVGSFLRTNKESHPVNNFSTRGTGKVTQRAIENSLSKDHDDDEDDAASAHFTVNTQKFHDACEVRRSAAGDFVFPLQQLGARRTDIDRHVDLETLVNLAYMCAGSNSHIFTASWKNQPVIIKLLQNEKTKNQIAVDEFELEAELLSRLDHPNIIKSTTISTTPYRYNIPSLPSNLCYSSK